MTQQVFSAHGGARRIGAAATITFAVIAACGLAIWLAKLPPSAAAEIADGLVGERWYAMSFGHRPIGHHRSNTRRTPEGHFTFDSESSFQLANESPTRMTDLLMFDAAPPHRLLRAEHAVYHDEQLTSQVSLSDGTASIRSGGGTRRIPADVRLNLDEYLAIEAWLAHATPRIGAKHSAQVVDFDQLATRTEEWRVVAQVGDELAVSKSANAAAQVWLDSTMAPVRMQLGPLLTLRAVDQPAAGLRGSESAAFEDMRVVPVDQAIQNQTALRRLVVELYSDTDVAPRFDALRSRLTADGSYAVADAESAQNARLPTVRYPADHIRLAKMARLAVADARSDRERAALLGTFVHHFLDYEDAAKPQGVLDTMRSRTGDCTEFADVYTAFARAVGLAARTVVGIAYRAGPDNGSPGFALHAWNEVAIDGHWHGVDPTWHQETADLTHFVLSDAEVLAFIAARRQLRLRVIEAVY